MLYTIADPKEDPLDKSKQIGLFESKRQAADYIRDSPNLKNWVVKEWHGSWKERKCLK